MPVEDLLQVFMYLEAQLHQARSDDFEISLETHLIKTVIKGLIFMFLHLVE